MPVSTFTLVAVPKIFLGILCASLYIIPLGICGLVLGIPFPLLPGATLVFCMTIVILCGTWITTSYKSRSVAVTLALLFSLLLFYWLDPLNIFSQQNSSLRKAGFSPDIVALDGIEYLALVLFSALLFGVTVSLVDKLRRGEPTRFSAQGAAVEKVSTSGEKGERYFFPMSKLVERLTDNPAFACPSGGSWQAETWLECKHYILPILLMGFTLAFLIPPLTLIGIVTGNKGIVAITGIGPFIMYFTGIGLSLFNRRNNQGGFMDAFEGTRAMSTMQLAGIQLLGTTVAIAIGIAPIKVSMALTQAFVGDLRDPFIELANLLTPIPDATFLMVLNNVLMEATIFVGMIMLFFCFHSCAIFWGRKFLAITALLALNALSLTIRIRQDEDLLLTFIILMWFISIGTGLLTLKTLARIFSIQVVTVRTGLSLILACLALAVCGYFNLIQKGYSFSHMDPEFLALNIVFLLLPLTLTALTLWCYDRLRHG